FDDEYPHGITIELLESECRYRSKRLAGKQRRAVSSAAPRVARGAGVVLPCPEPEPRQHRPAGLLASKARPWRAFRRFVRLPVRRSRSNRLRRLPARQAIWRKE